MEIVQALLAFAVAGAITLLFLPLWPLGIWAMLEWHRAGAAPDIGFA